LSWPVSPRVVSPDEARELALQAELAEAYGPLIVLEGAQTCGVALLDPVVLGAEPCVVIGSDVLVSTKAEFDQILANVAAAPIAAATACVLLRSSNATPSIEARFALESVTYSALQAGPEFVEWTSRHSPRTSTQADEDPVKITRFASALTVTLNRPNHGNAVNRTMQDHLAEAFRFALFDDSIHEVHLSGDGPHFSTGGDLDEFGTFPDPATAHLVRLQRSPARLLSLLRQQGKAVIVTMHGASAGSGVELAAFGSTVRAHKDATFWLPELNLGLVPGSGGSISIVDRIGTQRTAWLLLTGNRIDASTALAWGLIDAIGRP
jgi:enoyl-CoA hydratase